MRVMILKVLSVRIKIVYIIGHNNLTMKSHYEDV